MPAGQHSIPIGRLPGIEMIGSSVPKVAPTVRATKDAKQTMMEVWGLDEKNTTWDEEPTVADQLTNERYAGTWKLGPQTWSVYRLKEDADTVQLNNLMAQTTPDDAPRVVLQSLDKHFNDKHDHFTVLVSYRRVYYRRLILKQEPRSEYDY